MIPHGPGRPAANPRTIVPIAAMPVAVVAGWNLLAPATGRRLRIMDGEPWFVDSCAVLASSDAERQSIDLSAPNPLGPAP